MVLEINKENSFNDIKKAFVNYFVGQGYVTKTGVNLDESDTSRSFIRSIQVSPSLQFVKYGKYSYKSPRVLIPQLVVRPEDFFPAVYDEQTSHHFNFGKNRFRCGTFELLANWHTDLGRGSSCIDTPGRNPNSNRFWGLMKELIFLRDELYLDPDKMGFTLWPGGMIGDKGYIPRDEEAYNFLKEVWKVEDHQIGWDPENTWPDFISQELKAPEKSTLIAPRVEMYYFTSSKGSPKDFPIGRLENTRTVYMELMTYITIAWMYEPSTNDFMAIPLERAVGGIGFGVERAAVCVEGVDRVHDIGFFKEFKSLINDWALSRSKTILFEETEKGNYFFSQVIDRLRFLITATSQGIRFHRKGKGYTLKKYARELYVMLSRKGLKSREIGSLVEVAIDYLGNYYDDVGSLYNNSNEKLMNQLNPEYMLETL